MATGERPGGGGTGELNGCHLGKGSQTDGNPSGSSVRTFQKARVLDWPCSGFTKRFMDWREGRRSRLPHRAKALRSQPGFHILGREAKLKTRPSPPTIYSLNGASGHPARNSFTLVEIRSPSPLRRKRRPRYGGSAAPRSREAIEYHNRAHGKCFRKGWEGVRIQGTSEGIGIVGGDYGRAQVRRRLDGNQAFPAP